MEAFFVGTCQPRKILTLAKIQQPNAKCESASQTSILHEEV
jgi:hypothetical protein